MRGGVSFEGDLLLGFRVNLHVRTLTQVLLRLTVFGAKAFPPLLKEARKLPWVSYLQPGTKVAFWATSTWSRLFHTKRIRETVLDVVTKSVAVDKIDETSTPQQRVMIRMLVNASTISLDMSGERLHRRGYREEVGRAPIRETMAVGRLNRAGWQLGQPLIDPICGSGTFPIEAALLAAVRAPCLPTARDFQCLDWSIFDPESWAAICHEAASPPPSAQTPLIFGRDRAAGVICKIRRNAARVNCAELIPFDVAAAESLSPQETCHRG